MIDVNNELDRAWRSTTKIIFGRELGELKDYEGYLKEPLVGKRVYSHFSKNPLWVVSHDYCSGARFFENGKENEMFKQAMSRPMDINKVKDIDSLIGEVKERLIYSGNKTLGNSSNVADSDSVMDSTNILNSSWLIGSKDVAYSFSMQNSEYAFASTASGQSSHIIRCYYNNSLKRCFEICASVGASDCFFVYNTMSCQDCMFSFNLRAKQYNIGNITLDRQKYLEIKTKLVGEMTDDLVRKKRLDFSIVDIINGWPHE